MRNAGSRSTWLETSETIMKLIIPALLAMAVLSGIAAPANADDSHCPDGYSNAWGACFKLAE